MTNVQNSVVLHLRQTLQPSQLAKGSQTSPNTTQNTSIVPVHKIDEHEQVACEQQSCEYLHLAALTVNTSCGVEVHTYLDVQLNVHFYGKCVLSESGEVHRIPNGESP